MVGRTCSCFWHWTPRAKRRSRRTDRDAPDPRLRRWQSDWPLPVSLRFSEETRNGEVERMARRARIKFLSARHGRSHGPPQRCDSGLRLPGVAMATMQNVMKTNKQRPGPSGSARPSGSAPGRAIYPLLFFALPGPPFGCGWSASVFFTSAVKLSVCRCQACASSCIFSGIWAARFRCSARSVFRS